MPAVSLRHGVRYGFEPEDVRQEYSLGRILSFRRRPGDEFSARSRGKVRSARHKKQEQKYNEIRISLDELTIKPGSDEKFEPKASPGLQFEHALAKEIMDMLPYAEREEILKSLLEGDRREMRRIGRMFRERFPGLTKDSE